MEIDAQTKESGCGKEEQTTDDQTKKELLCSDNEAQSTPNATVDSDEREEKEEERLLLKDMETEKEKDSTQHSLSCCGEEAHYDDIPVDFLLCLQCGILYNCPFLS